MYGVVDGLFLVSDNMGLQGIKREIPYKASNEEAPFISALSALVVDAKTDKILYEKDLNKKLAPASTTKLMTALVSLDQYTWTDEVAMPKICTEIDTTKAWLPADSKYAYIDLLKSMLVSSAGDSACAISLGKVQYNQFLQMMNSRAKDLNMATTNFSNPIGLDGLNGENYSTAWDLYLLAKAALDNATIREIVKTKEVDILSTDGKFSNKLFNTNVLLWQIPGTVGVKTGTTTEAGEVLTYSYEDKDKVIYIVVMGSKDRFYDTRVLLEWAQRAYSWKSY